MSIKYQIKLESLNLLQIDSEMTERMNLSVIPVLIMFTVVTLNQCHQPGSGAW